MWISFPMLSFCFFNKSPNNVIDKHDCDQEKKCEYYKTLESVRDRERYAPKNISDDQKDQRPNKRGDKLDANKTSERNSKKTQYDKG